MRIERGLPELVGRLGTAGVDRSDRRLLEDLPLDAPDGELLRGDEVLRSYSVQVRVVTGPQLIEAHLVRADLAGDTPAVVDRDLLAAAEADVP